MSFLEQYKVNTVTKVPAVNPTQIRLAVVPKPNTAQHTPVSKITLAKGVPAGGSNRSGQEDPKDVAAMIYLNNADFAAALAATFNNVTYLSTDVTGQPIELITNFNF